jgi:hypothetical protein
MPMIIVTPINAVMLSSTPVSHSLKTALVEKSDRAIMIAGGGNTGNMAEFRKSPRSEDGHGFIILRDQNPHG